ncbi:MAG: ATP synthase F0 subunit C [Deltaproteobacteria bacterium]|jgi:F-type H+-transporting ATPase subunit c|nr:ATP synthase F0 subunit C [Deltaproteobacteria bacterium]MBN2844772.1 ATP synthase F0 subunit C [Deltaproteobacteria bacterium]
MRKSLKGIVYSLFTLFLLMVTSSFAIASEGAAAASGDLSAKALVIACSVLAAGIVMGIGAFGPGLGMGQATSGAANAVGRNPDAQGKIMLTMLVGMAMTESIAIYALVIALSILYANPLLKYIFG